MAEAPAGSTPASVPFSSAWETYYKEASRRRRSSGGGCVAASISSVLVSSELTGDKVEIPPYGSADIDGFRVDVGAVVVTSPLPGCSFGGPLDAAGVRLP